MKIKDFIWVFPFILFMCGYLIAHTLFNINEIDAPNIIGKDLRSGALDLSRVGLNVRILRVKEDPDLDENIILEQNPGFGTKIRPNASVRVVVSKKPDPKKAPDLSFKTEEEISRLAQKMLFKIKIFKVPSHYSEGSCIAQSPRSGADISDEMIAYISSGEERLSVFPSLLGENASDAQDFLLKHSLSASLYHKHPVPENHSCKKCKVLEQTPRAGSIINLKDRIPAQLLVG